MEKKESFYTFKLITTQENEKNKFKNIAGLTLLEMLIGVVISSIMMGAIYTTYTVVNNSYSQVTERAKLVDLVETLWK